MWPLLLLLPLLALAAPLGAPRDLPAPTNVILDSKNMESILRWDPVRAPNARTAVMYRVQCELYNYNKTLCENITETRCNLTAKVRPFWRAVYKVRAELGGRRSAWAAVPSFQASIHTTLGPVRSLLLQSRGNALTVDFSHPLQSSSSAFTLKYRLHYWKKGAAEKTEVPVGLTHHMLRDLEERTVYCVQVRAVREKPEEEKIEGELSDPECAETGARGFSGSAMAVTVGCVTAVCGICSAVGYAIYRNHDLLKRVLYPPFRMPYHMQEFLENPPEPAYEMVSDESRAEDGQDRISVLDATFVPEVNQLCAEPTPVSAEKT